LHVQIAEEISDVHRIFAGIVEEKVEVKVIVVVVVVNNGSIPVFDCSYQLLI